MGQHVSPVNVAPPHWSNAALLHAKGGNGGDGGGEGAGDGGGDGDGDGGSTVVVTLPPLTKSLGMTLTRGPRLVLQASDAD